MKMEKVIPQNYSLAMFYYKKAAKQNYPRAQRCLGILYANGHGVEKNVDKAFALYIKAAEQGDEVAQCNVGYYYDNGISVDLDPVKANEWYEKVQIRDLLYHNIILHGIWKEESVPNRIIKSICAIRKSS